MENKANYTLIGAFVIVFLLVFVGGRDLPLAKDTDSKDLFVIEGRRSQIDSLLDDGGSVVESVQKTLNSLMRTLDDDNIRDFQNILSNIEKITSEYRDNPLTAARLEQTLNNIDRAAKDVSVASVSVDQTSLDTRLAINDKFAPLLDSLQGTITEVDKTVVAYRQLAERSTALVDTTNGTVSDFSAGSLRQIESATVELKDLLNTLNRVAEELERNPTRSQPIPELLQDAAMQSLAQSGNLITITPPTVVRADYTLEPVIRAFEASFDRGEESPPLAKIRILVTLTDMKSRQVIAKKEFYGEQRATEVRVTSIVNALDSLTQTVMAEMAVWTERSLAAAPAGS